MKHQFDSEVERVYFIAKRVEFVTIICLILMLLTIGGPVLVLASSLDSTVIIGGVVKIITSLFIFFFCIFIISAIIKGKILEYVGQVILNDLIQKKIEKVNKILLNKEGEEIELYKFSEKVILTSADLLPKIREEVFGIILKELEDSLSAPEEPKIYTQLKGLLTK